MNKCHNGVIFGSNGWYYYWNIFKTRVDSGKNLGPRNTPELSVDFNLFIGD